MSYLADRVQIPASGNLPGHEEVEFQGIDRHQEGVRLADIVPNNVHEDLLPAVAKHRGPLPTPSSASPD